MRIYNHYADDSIGIIKDDALRTIPRNGDQEAWSLWLGRTIAAAFDAGAQLTKDMSSSRQHVCGVPGCYSKCPKKFIMCPRHWRMVDDALKKEVVSAMLRRNPDRVDETWSRWWRARSKAIYSVVQVQYPSRRRWNEEWYGEGENYAMLISRGEE